MVSLVYMKPLISVIIPVYNQAGALKHALESIANQTIKNIEIIVINDGSTDGLDERIDDYKKIVEFYYHKQKKQGAPTARNKGFKLSKGEFVIFWDADIVGKSHMLQKMYDVLKLNKQASYSYSNFYFANGKKMHCGEFNKDLLKKQNYITTTSLIRREDFPGFDKDIKRFQDWDLWLTMLDQGKVGICVPEYLFAITAKGVISNWLPKFAYKKQWKWFPLWSQKVKDYENARDIIRNKHKLKR